MVCTPCDLALVSMAAPESLSRLTIASTVAPLAIIWSAMVAMAALSPLAFWMSNSTPAFLKAASRLGRSWVSQRAEDLVSGRMTPILPVVPADPLPAAELAALDPADEAAAEVVLDAVSDELLQAAASNSEPAAKMPTAAVVFKRMDVPF